MHAFPPFYIIQYSPMKLPLSIILGIIGVVAISTIFVLNKPTVQQQATTSAWIAREIQDLPVKSPTDFFISSGNSLEKIALQNGVSISIQKTAQFCDYETSAGFSDPKGMPCGTSAANQVFMTQFWGPGETQDTHYDENSSLSYALGDAVAQYRDNAGILPTTAIRIDGALGKSQILGIQNNSDISVVIRQGKRTIEFNTHMWNNNQIQQLFSDLVLTTVLPK